MLTDEVLNQKVDVAKALKGGEVEKRLGAAAKDDLVPADAFKRLCDTVATRAASLNLTTVRDFENLPTKVGQLSWSGHGGDIYLVVAEVIAHYTAVATKASEKSTAKAPAGKN